MVTPAIRKGAHCETAIAGLVYYFSFLGLEKMAYSNNAPMMPMAMSGYVFSKNSMTKVLWLSMLVENKGVVVANEKYPAQANCRPIKRSFCKCMSLRKHCNECCQKGKMIWETGKVSGQNLRRRQDDGQEYLPF